LILYRAGPATAVHRLLSVQPLVFVGRISYSLYLWHWPLLAFWRFYSRNLAIGLPDPVTIMALAAAPAALSLRWIEQPFRRPAMTRRTVLAGAATAVLGISLMATAIVTREGLPERLPESVRMLGSLDATWAWTCPQSVAVGLPPFPGLGGDSCVV